MTGAAHTAAAHTADDRPVVLAAGGTGGHMFPAEALARELVGRGVRVVLLTDRRGQAFGGDLADIRVYRVRAGAPVGGVVRKARAAVDMLLGYGEARAILRALDPAAVVGFGGYPSVPAVFAASRLKLPLVLHEQNAVLGRANRLFAKKATAIATAFPDLQRLSGADPSVVVMTGNPVRRPIADLAGTPYTAPQPGEPVHLLVTGGSQGAKVFSELVPAAIAQLSDAARGRLKVSQQSRREVLEQTRRALSVAGVEAEVMDFFTDMPARLAAAHLVICRSGASTVAELAAAGRPALLVPFPHAMDDHQSANAAAMEAAGGGWMLPQATLDASALAHRIERLIDRPELLARAAEAARSLAPGDAAAALADLVLRVAGRNGNGAAAHGDPLAREAAE
ncbi:MAG: undecaprenyldiphospho-muramoylpentapeptide beta-N-acetylglucosaminyltransferase [Rhodospirillaceae bacterium]|nr:undecaprenyldiphospho-muramoylpentapeptide beta-N-acetylglucosaminyltransferase [Rhodospirillaceae bacterium]MCA8931784.1 undecaprenyldiphospho-muramoylpentapeptide beta-N-acetylglucosaminyltransferase [Rhodospirillaceae bacterium]